MLAWQLAFLGVALTCLGITLSHKAPADRIATFALYPIAALAFGIKYNKHLKDDSSKQIENLEKNKHKVEKNQLDLYKQDLCSRGVSSK